MVLTKRSIINDTAAEYAALKAKLHKGFKHDRDGYTKAKTEFIMSVTEKARKKLL